MQCEICRWDGLFIRGVVPGQEKRRNGVIASNKRSRRRPRPPAPCVGPCAAPWSARPARRDGSLRVRGDGCAVSGTAWRRRSGGGVRGGPRRLHLQPSGRGGAPPIVPPRTLFFPFLGRNFGDAPRRLTPLGSPRDPAVTRPRCVPAIPLCPGPCLPGLPGPATCPMGLAPMGDKGVAARPTSGPGWLGRGQGQGTARTPPGHRLCR